MRVLLPSVKKTAADAKFLRDLRNRLAGAE